MGTKIFVGNFSFGVNDESLKEYFAGAGSVVSAKVMTEGQGGKSRGFGFVEFSNPEDAKKALAIMHSCSEGREAAIIGQLVAGRAGRVIINTPVGGSRVVTPLHGMPLPRIC